MLAHSLTALFLILTGITSLYEAYSATPDYCNEEGQQGVATQLIHVNNTLLLLASLLKGIFNINTLL